MQFLWILVCISRIQVMYKYVWKWNKSCSLTKTESIKSRFIKLHLNKFCQNQCTIQFFAPTTALFFWMHQIVLNGFTSTPWCMLYTESFSKSVGTFHHPTQMWCFWKYCSIPIICNTVVQYSAPFHVYLQVLLHSYVWASYWHYTC